VIRDRARWSGTAASLVCLSIAALLNAALRARRPPRAYTELLYLPHSQTLSLTSFGYDLLWADLLYLWSIQYYSDPNNPRRFERIRQIYEVITDLDPRYLDAYNVGALIMALDYRDPRMALEHLERGMARNPQAWILPLDAGFYALMQLRDPERAAGYFRRAASLPGAPPISARLYAGSAERSGDKRAAWATWERIHRTTDDEYIRALSRRRADQLKVEIDLELLAGAIRAFRRARGRPPRALEELAPRFVPELPLDPSGEPYVYDPRSGRARRAGGFRVDRG
jgi:tetratricopeptide (TPR) repeat protein